MSFFFKSCAKASKVAMSTMDAQDIESFLANAEKVIAGSGQPSNGNSTSTTTHSSPPPPYPTSYANNTSKPEEPVYHIPPPPEVNKPVTQYHQPTYGSPSPALLSSAMYPDPSSIAISTASLPPYTASIPALGNAPAASHTTHTAITPSSPTFSSGHTKLPSTDPVSAKPTRISSMAAIPARKKRCRALFIGINYPGTRAALRGCVNDVKMMMKLLKHLNFSLDDIRILVDTDEVPNCHAKPTKANIIEGMKWLVEGAQDGDTLFLHYSGHGTQVKDTSGDEQDFMDEALVPCDYQSNGMIEDDEIVRLIVAPLPAGVRLTALLDCCHSGTLMDLPYTWVSNAANQNEVSASNVPAMILGSNWMNPSFIIGLLTGGNFLGNIKEIATRTCTPDGSKSVFPADVIMFSGCRDEQTSADVSSTAGFNIPAEAGPGGAGGACTSALTEVLMTDPSIPFVQLLEKMRVNLKNRKFTQVPQLSSSKPVDLGRPFCFFGPISTATAKVGEPNNKLQRKLNVFGSIPQVQSMIGQLPGPLGDAVSSAIENFA